MSMDNMKTADLKVLLGHKERELENLRASNKTLLDVLIQWQDEGWIDADKVRAAIAKTKII
jgi:hypothetical protein